MKQRMDDAKKLKERGLLSYDLPAGTTQNGINAPARVNLNTDGSVQNGNSSSQGFFNTLGNKVSTVTNFLAGALYSNPESPFYNLEKANEHFDKSSAAEIATHLPKITKQQQIDGLAENFRKQYPSVAKMFPRDHNGELDVNSGKLVNYVSDALKQSQTVIDNLLVPENHQIIDDVQKDLFKDNVFNKVTYHLRNGKLGTKNEAMSELGFSNGVPQKELNQAVFNGYGGFADPGAIHAQVPDKNGIPKDIVIDPDATTKSIYMHSRKASEVYQTGKAKEGIEYIKEGNKTVPYYFTYSPDIDETGAHVTISQYRVTKDGKKGELVGEPEDAFSVYAAEHSNWLQYNKYSLK